MARIILWLGIAIAITLAYSQSVAAAGAPTEVRATIHDPADLDRYLATTLPGDSPLDRFSRPAKQRFITTYHRGTLHTWDMLAELTQREARDILSLFGLEADVPSKMRKAHLDLGSSETPTLTAAFARMIDVSDKPSAELAEYRRAFAPHQSPAALHTMSDGDVALSLQAAMTAGIDARDAELDLDELSRRDLHAPNWIPSVYAKWIEQGDMAAAGAFRARHSGADLPPLPPVRDETRGTGPTWLDVAEDGSVLMRRTLSLDPKAEVVVVGGCHFSEEATRDIEADPALRTLFSRHVVWIAQAQGNLGNPDLARWNRDHPIAALHIIDRQNEWPAIDTWSIPTFYFFRDGKVVSKVVAWRGNRQKVLAGFSHARARAVAAIVRGTTRSVLKGALVVAATARIFRASNGSPENFRHDDHRPFQPSR